MELTTGATTLKNLGHLNVIFCKNGVGKSPLLRALDAEYEKNPNEWLVKYISPERGGGLAFDPSVESNMRSGNWATTHRRRNRAGQFRNMSFAEYKTLEILVLRKREADGGAPVFDDTLSTINALLDQVQVVRASTADPQFMRKEDQAPQSADTLSSGESELLSLAIEILAFCHQVDHADNAEKKKLLLLDEPDVHLHPDLQHRLVELISAATAEKDITTLVATHSTAPLSAYFRRICKSLKVQEEMDHGRSQP